MPIARHDHRCRHVGDHPHLRQRGPNPRVAWAIGHGALLANVDDHELKRRVEAEEIVAWLCLPEVFDDDDERGQLSGTCAS